MASNMMSKGVRELRFILCQTNTSSAGVRSFIANNYQAVKSANPQLPFLVRECENAQPCITARYDYGVERKVYLIGANEAEVGQAIDDLVASSSQINAAAAQRF